MPERSESPDELTYARQAPFSAIEHAEPQKRNYRDLLRGLRLVSNPALAMNEVAMKMADLRTRNDPTTHALPPSPSPDRHFSSSPNRSLGHGAEMLLLARTPVLSISSMDSNVQDKKGVADNNDSEAESMAESITKDMRPKVIKG